MVLSIVCALLFLAAAGVSLIFAAGVGIFVNEKGTVPVVLLYLFIALIFLSGGVYFLTYAVMMHQCGKTVKYLSGENRTFITELSLNSGQSEAAVRNNLEFLIKRDFLKYAYVDMKENCFFFIPEEQTVLREKIKKAYSKIRIKSSVFKLISYITGASAALSFFVLLIGLRTSGGADFIAVITDILLVVLTAAGAAITFVLRRSAETLLRLKYYIPHIAHADRITFENVADSTGRPYDKVYSDTDKVLKKKLIPGAYADYTAGMIIVNG